MNTNLLENSISLKDAIRLVQEELINSQVEREMNDVSPLFEVERLTIEANCIFTKKENSELGFDVRLLSLFSLKAGLTDIEENSFVQKIKLELKAIKNSDDTAITGINPYESMR